MLIISRLEVLFIVSLEAIWSFLPFATVVVER